MALTIVSCGRSNAPNTQADQSVPIAKDKIVQYKLQILDTLPHSTDSYTQGLEIANGKLYEGTGLEGHSKLLRYDLKTMKIEKDVSIGANYFGEGITILNNRLYQLTWLNQTCLTYNSQTLQPLDTYKYMGEGWGITHDDSLLYTSDGSASIKVIEPATFATVRTIRITKDNNPVRFLNELELIDTLLYANVYMQDLIIVADIRTGKVVGEIDISELRYQLVDNPEQEVSNGIAFNSVSSNFYITGKRWNKMFVVRFLPQ
jgi:glutamine cyclotransferase